MGRYCDICKATDKESTIGFVRTDNEWYSWCDFNLEICKSCADKLKESIEKVIR